jgi:hypothetical protein
MRRSSLSSNGLAMRGTPHVNAGRGKLLSYGYPAVKIQPGLSAGLFYCYKSQSRHARHRRIMRSSVLLLSLRA